MRSLYDLYVDRLYFVVRRYIKDEFSRENVLQDVFLKIFNALDKFDSQIASFNTWSTTIAIRESLNALRKKKMDFVPLDYFENEIMQSLDPLLAAMETDQILSIIDQIPDKYSVIFNLYEIDGYDHNEISEMLKIPASTSRSYLSRAKKLIQNQMKYCLN